ncbi:hypothetical protein P872_18655 [Rhodonellum psychrophilum GCM71 = DSM 17998]|uniref:Mechanosensitive ion channel n=2 Tax=Rhodonellum TaxID=336827 RepID=U5C069_9BACT|nr:MULTISPECIES: mechanosensitive ion channel domain-containing protein [Rhodonellum]ERM82311.1 hypothetical protein P872_18655 [Rhodonellum psychrophilum GCM71 = DSM 17998]
MMKVSFLFRNLFLFSLWIGSHVASAQDNIDVSTSSDSILVSSGQKPTDSIAQPKASVESSIRKNLEFTITLNRINNELEKELDTVEIMQSIPFFERLVNTVNERLEVRGSKVNLRYLSALENFLASIKNQVLDLEKPITKRGNELIAIRDELDAVKKDDLFQYSLRDSTVLPEYQLAITLLKNRMVRTDSVLTSQRLLAASFQSRISSMTIKIEELSSVIDFETRKLEKELFNKENNYIWEPREFTNVEKLGEIFRDSLRLNEVIFSRYFKNHIPISLFLFGISLALYAWIRYNLKRITQEKDFSAIILERVKFVNSFQFLSALIFVLPLAPFFYPKPPISFETVILIALVLVTSILLKKDKPWKVYWNWILFIFVFLFYTASNLYWEIAFQERWHLLALSFIGVFLANRLVVLQKKSELKLPIYLSYLAKFYIALQVGSILANVFGRFSLAKMLGVASTMSFVQAVSLYIFVTVIMEMIYLQFEVSKKQGNEYTSYWDFQGIQERLKKVFSGLAFIIWGYYFLDNLSIFNFLLGEAKLFLTTPWSLFSGTFTFGSVAIFFLVVYLASILANNIAYFASIKDQQKPNQRDKRLGSSILLIRLGVLSLGMLIAIGASGIPIDKITIILGALSLGIGFGLQTIVNNLVSGIILAFERPIQIGDDIEVGGKSGKVKDVGIRSSKLQAYDGSEIIIPNGDLLSQHLINWTLSDKKRRVELLIGVGYDSDMELVRDVLRKQLDQEEILKKPEPRVYLQTFGDSSVDFRVLFWVDNYDLWIEIRNQVMFGIFKAFKEQGIEIPFPQRDLHLKNLPATIRENVKTIKEIEEEIPEGQGGGTNEKTEE